MSVTNTKIVIVYFSYDEQLLIWDSRQMRRPITEIGLGGGIWRIKWEPSTGVKILTATMYNGFQIIDTSSLNGMFLYGKCSKISNTFLYFLSNKISRDMCFPTMWHFDKCTLRRACAASF